MMKNLLKYASLLFAAVMLFACGKVAPDNTDDDGNGYTPDDSGLVLKADKQYIHANGEDAVTLTVTYNGLPMTEDIIFSNSEGEVLDIEGPDYVFVTEEVGEYEIYAEYLVNISESIRITAVPMPVPESPEDPDADNFNFKRRILLTYFTGTDCPNCPTMKDRLKEVSEDPGYADKYVNTVVHQFGSSDPAYFSGGLPSAIGVGEYPSVALNLDKWTLFSNENNVNGIKADIDEEFELAEAKVGISATVVSKDASVMVKAVVKAAVSGNYRIGAWLLEDAIEGQQKGGSKPEHHIHDDCLRIADSKVSNSDWSGHMLGYIEAGKTAEYMFSMNLKSKWKAENCHVVIFVTSPAGSSYWVNNAIDVHFNDSVTFEYLD